MKKRRWKKTKAQEPKDEDVVLLDELVQLEDVRGGLRKLTFGEGADLGEGDPGFGVGNKRWEGINRTRDRKGPG